MNKTRLEKSIGWTDKTINPIKGTCKGGCWYCWTKPFYTMKRLTPRIREDFSVFDKLPKKPKKIFLCSTHDLFGDWIPDYWKEIIFRKIKLYPQHTFQILTKFPENIQREMPDNVWLGVSVTKSDDVGWNRLTQLKEVTARIKFVSFEPLLGLLNASIILNSVDFDWFIFGKLTGYGKKYDVQKRDLICNVNTLKDGYKKPVFLKENLKDIWGEDLIQEFPG